MPRLFDELALARVFGLVPLSSDPDKGAVNLGGFVREAYLIAPVYWLGYDVSEAVLVRAGRVN